VSSTSKITFNCSRDPPGVNFLYIEIVERHCAQLFDEKTSLYVPQSSVKSWAQKSWKRSSTNGPKEGWKKLGVKNCVQLPINRKLTRHVLVVNLCGWMLVSKLLKVKLRCFLLLSLTFPLLIKLSTTLLIQFAIDGYICQS
jgi:hypothetical protein